MFTPPGNLIFAASLRPATFTAALSATANATIHTIAILTSGPLTVTQGADGPP
ncbi:hypothetical protein GCM10008955_30680 [Deinococcus malanensis]|uniref:Uncharacterized protein n=1 Tax=Deinococcus malanensis TaxID=1706855 RepID=A0ABQ2EZL0_9DEIO|nr:hypothetical protein GCM10008955_30680 [Deinococcus malanensis]